MINAIAAFGDDAVDGVLDVAGSVQSEPRVVASAIRVLERMLYDGASLSATSMAGILEVANQRLSGTQAYIVLAKAAELAVATGDSQLRRRVERLAQDPDAVRAVIRGDDLDVENTQRRATAALASNPAR